ncbi:glycosyltransferase family 39 protein [Phycomyces blakesleeanus]|uniref:dolichyl-phosphate-mannose--protein mannosyltransferase n=2 Tax=Phycomyces blakesleeanus TaxID=4837 RepID=A0A162PKI0_PHYB8|nr:glycosyltransferase family 39 protein [Phycomyces blakesleeanus NRRL 1555(-)]OAD73677.1 glycosyltransferase family 39 protein [Phycomyces blakesleeanus NRRL 1555(-)]|eukprot:XP_018291717.1 glycosyltransferase family 39 protein [Phycomyces blakesleeanus NRRL 1555(-)]
MFSLRYRRAASKSDKNHNDHNSPIPLYQYGHEDMQDDYDSKLKKQHANMDNQTGFTVQDYIQLVMVTILAASVRVWTLNPTQPISLSELEIVNQIDWYIQSKFFIGTSPPLAGLLYTKLAQLAGYTGNANLLFDGQSFGDFPAQPLRTFASILGVMMIPMGYTTIRLLGHSQLAAILVAGLLAIENGMVTQSQFFSSEGLVYALTAASMLSWAYVYKIQQRDSTKTSWTWQSLTGLLIGCAMSTKWQGICGFVIIWAATVRDTWKMLSEKNKAMSQILRHLSSRVVSIGALPVAVYLGVFYIHFQLVPNAGDHDLLISSKLKYSLEGNHFKGTYQEIPYGSRVVLKHVGTAGGYLNSHNARYATGSTQQIVSLYPFTDINNIWIIQKGTELWNSSQPFETVKTNDHIRLEHFVSKRKLHSHNHRPPMSSKKEHHEVTAYGDRHLRDNNDSWWARVLNKDDKIDPSDKTPIKALSSRLRLLHSRGCYLMSHNIALPAPALNQQEVSCMSSASKALSTFVIEAVYHEGLEGKPKISYSVPSFFEKLNEVHDIMANFPNVMHDRLATVPLAEAAKSKNGGSQRSTPLGYLLRARNTLIWDELSGRSVYMIFNLVIQRLVLFNFVAYGILLGFKCFAQKRQIQWSASNWSSNEGTMWSVHESNDHRDVVHGNSLEYFLAGSILYTIGLSLLPSHTQNMADLLPCIYLCIGATVLNIESLTNRLGRARLLVFLAVFGLAAHSFLSLSPLAYGTTPWTQDDCRASGLKSLDCLRFPSMTQIGSEIDSDSTQKRVVLVDVPGQRYPFDYVLGEEFDADKSIHELRSQRYTQEAEQATGVQRYHRATQTVGYTQEQNDEWADKINKAGLARVEAEIKKQNEKKKVETEKAAKEALKAEAEKGTKNPAEDSGKASVAEVQAEAKAKAKAEATKESHAQEVKEQVQEVEIKN